MFRDRDDAGHRLAAALQHLEDEPDLVVVAIPRGGVVVGAVVAKALGAALDVVIPRKIGAPGNPELAVGAVAGDGGVVINEDIATRLGVDDAYVEQETQRQVEEIRRRRDVYLAGREPVDVKGKTVVLVDDGLATGSTAIAAARALRLQEPRRLVLGVPVAPRETLARLAAEVDEVVCVERPSFFYAVGQFYAQFDQTTDSEVVRLLRETHGDAKTRSAG